MPFKIGDRVRIIFGSISPVEKGVITNTIPEMDDSPYGYKVNDNWFFFEELELDIQYYRDIKLKEVLG